MVIGNKIKALRLEKQITQRQLAEQTNFSHSYIGDLESNRTTPSIKTLESIAEFFNLKMGYFFEEACCYENLLRGVEEFCYWNSAQCKKCPLKISQDKRS